MKIISKNKHYLNLVTIIISIILIFSTNSFSIGYQANFITDITENYRDNTYLSVIPSNQTVNYSESFNITIHLNPGEPIIGVQIDLSFNASLIQAVNVSNANPDVWDFFGPPIINNTDGIIIGAGVAVLGTNVPIPVDCFNITFTAQSTNGTSSLDLQNTIVVNQSGQIVVSLSIINGEVTICAPNNPPNTPSNPSPENGSINISINADLSWSCSDPDGDPLTFDIYFGTNSNPPLFVSGWSLNSFDPSTMNFDTIYYWRIVAWDNHSAYTCGPTWYFTTKSNSPPNKPLTPSGEDMGRAGVRYTYTTKTTDIDGDLIWYLFNWSDGTDSGWIGPYVSNDIASASHIWTEKGTYYIQVKAKDVNGAESLWSYPLSVTMPKNKMVNNQIFLRFLERIQRIMLILFHH